MEATISREILETEKPGKESYSTATLDISRSFFSRKKTAIPRPRASEVTPKDIGGTQLFPNHNKNKQCENN